MADAIQFTVPDDDFIELAGAGASGSVLHQGSASGGGDSTIILVESATKPTLGTGGERFKAEAASLYLKSGESEPYFDATTIWAVSAKGDQLLSVTPSA
ncbi:hypothetical protein NVP1246O_31 [Vibrio phage 1.246.O._10N.261.54.E10]|nr:hypothetical protein NVP1246O_31 [Vibrio phage 1.246.O._10N.261.54.E10]